MGRPVYVVAVVGWLTMVDIGQDWGLDRRDPHNQDLRKILNELQALSLHYDLLVEQLRKAVRSNE